MAEGGLIFGGSIFQVAGANMNFLHHQYNFENFFFVTVISEFEIGC